MTDKIYAFLKDREIKNATNGTWLVGTLITRAAVTPLVSLKTLKNIQDQFVINRNCDTILPIVSEIIRQNSNEIKDPASLDVETASFCSIMYYVILGQIGAPSVIFVTAKPVSDASTNVILDGYCLGQTGMLKGYVKKMHEAVVQGTL